MIPNRGWHHGEYSPSLAEVTSPGTWQMLTKLWKFLRCLGILRNMTNHLICIRCYFDHFYIQPRDFTGEGESGSIPVCLGAQGRSCEETLMVLVVHGFSGSWGLGLHPGPGSGHLLWCQRIRFWFILANTEQTVAKMASHKSTAGTDNKAPSKESDWCSLANLKIQGGWVKWGSYHSFSQIIPGCFQQIRHSLLKEYW